MDFDSYYLLALRYLNVRFRSEKEIRDYLKKKILRQIPYSSRTGQAQDDKRKSDAEQMIDLIIYKLKQQKFLNDEEFAKMWVRSSTSYKPKGKYRISLELHQKGISQEIIDKVLVDPEVRLKSDVDLAVETLEKKKKRYEGMQRQELFTKAGQMLARKGFDLDTIKAAIDVVFGK